MEGTVRLLVAIALAVIMVMPVLSGSADGMGTQDDLSDRSSYAADVLTFDESSYDDPRLFVVFAALSVIVLYLLYREIKKHGIYSEEFRKGSDRVYCPECGNEISAEDEFCPVCGYRPTKRRSFLRGSATAEVITPGSPGQGTSSTGR